MRPISQGKTTSWQKWIEAYTPKSIICLRQGYGRRHFINDLVAGVTVGVIALPLSMALAMGSHVLPAQGLFTAIVAGFLISLLGGSRVQIGGPAGAFMVLIASIVDQHGYQGLAICTLMASVILIIMGLARLGAMIKFIPYPVITGFTSGIAVLIFSSQVKDFLGLTTVADLPSEFIHKWHVLATSLPTWNGTAVAFGAGSLLILLLMRRFAPKVPAALIVVVLAGVLTEVLGLARSELNPQGLETIGSKFGAIPRMLPAPHLPIVLNNWEDVARAWALARALVPEATTIAILCSIESLLCAVVADGMIGGRHKSNLELCAQGVANGASVLFGGIPATGAIARTMANIKSGGRTPLAGMIHAVTLAALMLLFAPYAGRIPLASLAAILILVAYSMAEIDHFRSLLRAPRSDLAVLLTTFGLTVLADLTVAVGVGMVLASLLFMRRMSEVTNFSAIREGLEDLPGGRDALTDKGDPNAIEIRDVPAGVEVFEINGPFFFGVADRLKDTLRELERPPKVFILRMRRVPAIDASGLHALEEFHAKCARQHTVLLLAGVHAQPMFAIVQYGLVNTIGEGNLFSNIDTALQRAAEITGAAPPAPLLPHVPEVAGDRPARDA